MAGRNHESTLAHLNRRGGAAFRQAVALFLIEHGHSEVRPTLPPTRVSDVLKTCGDLDGIPRFAVTTRAAQAYDFSSLLDEARDLAKDFGRPWGAAIHARRGRPMRESYVVIGLGDFAEILTYLPKADASP